MHSHRIATTASSRLLRRAGLRFNVPGAGGESIARSRSESRLGLKPSARSTSASRGNRRGRFVSSASLAVFVPFSTHWPASRCPEQPRSGRSRFDVSGVTGLESTGIDQHFPRTCNDPSVHAVFRAIDRDGPPGDTPLSVSTPARQQRAAVVAMADRDQACWDPDITFSGSHASTDPSRFYADALDVRTANTCPDTAAWPGDRILPMSREIECDRLTALLGLTTLRRFAPAIGWSREWIDLRARARRCSHGVAQRALRAYVFTFHVITLRGSRISARPDPHAFGSDLHTDHFSSADPAIPQAACP
jgi:hypothetical protein